MMHADTPLKLPVTWMLRRRLAAHALRDYIVRCDGVIRLDDDERHRIGRNSTLRILRIGGLDQAVNDLRHFRAVDVVGTDAGMLIALPAPVALLGGATR